MIESLGVFLARCRSLGLDDGPIKHAVDTHPLLDLERRWYDALATGSPDYGIYGADIYLADVWYCWQTYSSRYLKLLAKRDLKPRIIIDVGCGLGYSTAELKLMYPDADVYGTNIEGTTQWRFAEQLAAQYRFTLLPSLDLIGDGDLVFASEYFEHFFEPVRELEKSLVLLPRWMAIANTFGQRSLGHFDRYLIGDQYVEGRSVSRRFNEVIRRRGYRKVETGWWNNRPVLWERRV